MTVVVTRCNANFVVCFVAKISLSYQREVASLTTCARGNFLILWFFRLIYPVYSYNRFRVLLEFISHFLPKWL